MALNSSGPLSFGGSTTGQSINLELGVSATALASINSSAFRTLAAIPSGQISVSNFYGKSNGARQWALTQTSPYGGSNDVFIDSAGNQYVSYSVTVNQPWRFGLAKWNASNVLQFSSTYVSSTTQSGGNTIGGQSIFDSSGNMYFTANPVQSSGTPYRYDAVFTKINSSGTTIYTSRISLGGFASGGTQVSGYAIAPGPTYTNFLINMSGSVVTGYDCCGYPLYTTTFYPSAVRASASSGAVQLVKYYSTSGLSNSNVFMSVVVQISDAPIFVCVVGSNSYGLVKTNVDLTPTVAKYFNFLSPLNNSQPNSYPILDVSGANLYDTNFNTNSSGIIYAKFSTSTLDLVYFKSITGFGTIGGQLFTSGTGVDSSDNFYISGYGNLSSNSTYAGFVMKFNAAGTLQWAIRITAASATNGSAFNFILQCTQISINGTTMSFAGRTVAQNNITTYNVDATLVGPTDGSLGGTVTTIPVPSTGTGGVVLTITNITPTVSTTSQTMSSMTVNSSTVNPSNPSESISTSSLTVTRAVSTI